jgi:hypothetical protein
MQNRNALYKLVRERLERREEKNTKERRIKKYLFPKASS